MGVSGAFFGALVGVGVQIYSNAVRTDTSTLHWQKDGTPGLCPGPCPQCRRNVHLDAFL